MTGGRASAPPSGLDFLVVLSLERTGGTSVAQSLKTAAADTPVEHVHFFDGDRYRGGTTLAAKQAALARKRQREAHKRQREARVRDWLSDPRLNGVVFSVIRDPLSRIVSGLWYQGHEMLAPRYDPAADAYPPGALSDIVERRLEGLVQKQARYGVEVYEPLGLPARPEPGEYRSRTGARVFVLEFAYLAGDFLAATQAVFGRPVPLAHVNGGGHIGDARAYAAFKRYCVEALEARGLTLTT